MKLRTIQTNKVLAVGPYSQAVIAGNFIFCAGQIGIDFKTNTIVEGIEKQTHQVLQNLQQVLKASGTNMNNVIKTTMYLTNINDFSIVNEIYATYFKTHKPARATVQVSRLPKGVLIEIDAIAVKK